MSRPGRRRKRIVPPADGQGTPKGEQPPVAKPKAVPAKPKAVPAEPAAAKPKAVPAKPAAAKPRAATPKPAAARPAAAKPRAAKPAPAKPAAAKPRAARPKTAASKPPQAAKAAPPAKEPPDPYVGKTIARCRIIERVGLGRTAAVYRAHHEALDTEVAVKILRESARQHPELVERFESEAKVIAQLDNENIVKIYDVGHEGTTHYLVMELLAGTEILEVIQDEERLEPMDALRVIRQAANGLAAAHARSIIHRDVKPQNLLLLEDGTVKVLDFGLATTSEEAGQRVGTPHYMAPEICRDGQGDLGSDVYALGIVLFHLLTGQPPYAGNDIQTILRKHMEGVPLRPERERRDLPPKVAELVRTLTKADPLSRPSATEVVEMLDGIGGEQLLEKATLKGRRPGRHRALAAARRSRSNATPAIIGVGLLALVGILVLVLSGGGDDPADGGTGTTVAGTSGSTPGGTGPAPANPGGNGADPGPVTPPTESEAARKAREEREARELAQRREAAAVTALTRAHKRAREAWHSPDDTKQVIDIYRNVANEYKATPAGKEALQIIRDIKDEKRHPHPDRSYSDAQSIAETRRAWEENQPLIIKDIQAYKYMEATKRLPAVVNDADGALAEELAYWHAHLEHLRDLRTELAKAVGDLAEDDRVVQTPDGEATVTKITTQGFEVSLDGEKKSYGWDAIGAKATGELALTAFEDKGARFLVLQMALAVAHDLDSVFFDRMLDLDFASDKGAYERIAKEYQRRVSK